MRLLVKKKGFATVPLLAIFLVFIMILLGVYISYEESQRMIYRTDDAVTVSLQGVCLFDRYEYATGSQQGKKIVCFYPGADNLRYSLGNDAVNLELTKDACRFAYELYLNVLQTNISAQYVVVPSASSGGLSNYVKKFEMTNVYDGTAYIYDIISGTTKIISPAAGIKSILSVEMGMDMQFPLFGIKTIKIDKIGKLELRIN